jgi:hypothetical protein
VVAEVLSFELLFVLLLETFFELDVVAEVLSFLTGLFVASAAAASELQLCCFFNWHWWRARASQV